MATTTKITTRLRPDVDRRLRAAAALSRTRISTVINQALDEALPGLPELGAMLTHPPANGAGRSLGGAGASPGRGHHRVGGQEANGDDDHA